MRLGHGHIAESPLKFTVQGSNSPKVDGGGDVFTKAVRGDVLDEILATYVIQDMHSNGVSPGRDFENNTKVKSGKEDQNFSKTAKEDAVWIVCERRCAAYGLAIWCVEK